MLKRSQKRILALLLICATLLLCGCAANDAEKLELSIIPTGVLEEDEFPIGAVYVNDNLYCSNYIRNWMDEVPKGYKLHGTIVASGYDRPQEELHASYIAEGYEIYTSKWNRDYIYMVYMNGRVCELVNSDIVTLVGS